MKKAKFKINGMHCNSCSLLIEEKINNLSGVIKSKINHESGKGVIVYDENVIKETEIQSEIESAGEYSVEKNEDIEIQKNGEYHSQGPEKKKAYSFSDLSIPVSIIIAGLLITGAIVINNTNGNDSKKTITLEQAAQKLPSNDARPSEVPIIAQFKITKDDHVRGDFNAPITLVEFSDFECPYCERHYPTLNKILSDYKGRVRLVYKHFPLAFHENGQKSAEASECASEQGKFWEYHDKLFENLASSGYSLANFKQWAIDIGLNSQNFNQCLDSGKYAQKVQADFEEGTQKGVNGTPATFVNGQLISGALPYESFKEIIDSLLK